MSLSSDLISQFVKVTKDEKQTKTETVVFGNIVYDGRPYVKLDGSDQLTPVTTTADVHDGERVTVMIKDHTATVTGNVSSPAARTDDVKEVADEVSEFEIVMSYKVTTEDLEASNATIESLRAKVAKFDSMQSLLADIYKLQADFAELEYVDADTVKALNAEIDYLEAKFGEFTDVSTEDLEAMYAEIDVLRGYTADYTYVSADVLHAVKASIDNLDVGGLTVEEADIRYANIDFTNIGEAAIDTFFAKSGIIEEVTISEGVVVKELVGVTIKGDLIEGGTVKADKLVVKGSDGLYYKLNVEAGATTSAEVTEDDLQNGLHGTAIIAKTITAEKVSVDDLVAFDATIGGFNITENSLYSGLKNSVDADLITGIYMDNNGQVSIGDNKSYLKFHRDANGDYKLDISVSQFTLGSSNSTIEEVIQEANDATILQCEGMISEAGDSYVKTDDFADFQGAYSEDKDNINAKIEDKFNQTSASIEDVREAFNSFIFMFDKYIKFSSETAITIGSGDNAITLELDNETGIIFKKHDEPFGKWDGTDFYTGNIVVEMEKEARFGPFAYRPREDGLSFLKVGV